MRLGHITYSNCFPVHARLLDRPEPGDPELVEGIPSQLNRLLRAGEIDASPSSSIEFARNADDYRIIPRLVIGSRGPVRSILFLSDREPSELGNSTVAVPSASATSVVLLRVLLRLRWGVDPRFVWFDQAVDDPFAGGADAALFIGDVALRPGLFASKPVRLDLGQEWWDHTGLPFAFAVWQTRSTDEAAVLRLRETLVSSREYGATNRDDLAQRHHARFGLPADMLSHYWATLTYELDEPMIRGLHAFYALAAKVGELPRAPKIRWTPDP